MSAHPLDLNLATRPFRNNVLPWAATLLGGAVLAAATVWNVEVLVEARAGLAAQRDELDGAEARLAQLDLRDQKALKEIGRIDVKSLTVQSEKANQVILRKALSWTELFNLLEELQPPEVRMTSIRPVFRREGDDKFPEGAIPVSVEGVSRSLEAFLELERVLIRDPHVDRVEPESTVYGENGEMVFDLRFLYYPDRREGAEIPDLPSFFPEDGRPEDLQLPPEEGMIEEPVDAPPEARPPERAASPPPPRPPSRAATVAPTPQEAEKAKSWTPRLQQEPPPPEGEAPAGRRARARRE